MNRTTRGSSRLRRSVLVLGAVPLFATMLMLAASASAVDVRGAVRTPSGYGQPPAPAAEQLRRNRYWDEWNGFLDPRPRGFDIRRDITVVLTGPGDPAPEQPGFSIANGGLWPTTIVARTGGNLEIANSDPLVHQLFAEGFSEFSPTATAPGLTRRVPIATAGSWPLRDEVYDHVRGHLHVIDDLIARARIAADGSYHFTNVPPGTYTLKIFQGADVVHTREGVVVADRELTMEPIQLTAPAAGGS